MKQSLEELFQLNIETAKETFAQQGEVRPMFIIHTEDGFIPVMTSFANEEEKGMVLRLVMLLNLKYRAYAYSVVHEAWMKKCNGPEKDFEGEVKDQPDKSEALVVSYVGYDHREMRTLEITRNGDKVELGEPNKYAGSVSGRLFDLLPPPEVHQRKRSAEDDKMLDMLISLVCQKFGIAAVEVRPN